MAGGKDRKWSRDEMKNSHEVSVVVIVYGTLSSELSFENFWQGTRIASGRVMRWILFIKHF